MSLGKREDGKMRGRNVLGEGRAQRAHCHSLSVHCTLTVEELSVKRTFFVKSDLRLKPLAVEKTFS